jgi:hypothetical protein
MFNTIVIPPPPPPTTTLSSLSLSLSLYLSLFLAHHIQTAEDKKVSIKFVEGGTVHSLPWSELLTLDEVPFESLEVVVECVWDESTLSIKHAEAIVVSKGVLK